MSFAHPSFFEVTSRHLAAKATEYFGAPRRFSVTPAEESFGFDVHLELVVGAAATPDVMSPAEAAEMDAVVGEELAFTLPDRSDLLHPIAAARLSRPLEGLREALVPAYRAAARELVGSEVPLVGAWFLLAPGALAFGELVVLPPSGDVAHAALIALVDVGAIALDASVRAVAHTDLVAMSSALGGVRIEKNEVRVAIPLARLHDLTRPVHERMIAGLDGAPVVTGGVDDVIRQALAEIANGELAGGTRAALDVLARGKAGEVTIGYVEYRLLVRIKVLVARLRQVAHSM